MRRHGPIPPWFFKRRGRRRGLQARLLLWFVGAILLAIGVSVVTTWLTADPNSGEYPSRVVSRHVQQRVAKNWDDPAATEAYLVQLRENTGLDIRVRRDPNFFGQRARPIGGMVFEDGLAYVPVQRRGEVVGALEIHTGAPAPRPWRVVLALVAALLALSLAARRVAMRLARPLEHVASTAERFGAGDLTARADVGKFSNRWVADEVRDLGQAFDGMADRISRVVTDQRELLAAISHELRSPLARARIALEIARERSPDRAHDDIERQIGEADAILADLLASARAGLADLHRADTAIGPWIEQRAAAETTGPVSVTVAAATTRASIDAALLGRAFHNLLANAWAHGHPKDVPLEVTVDRAEDGFVRVAVRDHGPGFADDILPRAFDPFVTGSGSSARTPGSHGIGLGLSLVRRIVEAHGGRVSAVNVVTDGKTDGAIVGLELPVLEAA